MGDVLHCQAKNRMKKLQCGYHNGIIFYPLDVALSTSVNRPCSKLRDIDKRTCG